VALKWVSIGELRKVYQMAGIMRSGVIGGSMLLVAASNLMVAADDRLFPVPAETHAAQPLSAQRQVGELMPPAPGQVQPFCYNQVCSPQRQPCQRSGFSRFKQRCQAKYWGYPEEFCEPPLGTMLMGFQMTQIANGQAARMALYQYDFLPASELLNPRGQVQLARMATWLTTNDFPIYVEPTFGDPELDELRRQTVWFELSGKSLSIPSERVRIGSPNVRGLDAADALLIDRNRLELTGTRGASGGGGSSTSTSSSTETTSTTDESN